MGKEVDHSWFGAGKLRLNRYYKERYLSWLVLYNIMHLVSHLTKLSLPQLLPLVVIIITLLKMVKVPWVYSFLMIGSNDCASLLLRRIDIELSNCIWLINKLNLQTMCFTFILAVGLWSVEKYSSVSLAWWIMGNMLILYLGATRFSKSWIKYQLRLYR